MLSLHCTGWQVAGESVICERSVTATREGSPYPFGGIETASNTVSRICNCYLLLGIRGNTIDKRFPKSNSPLLQESQECAKKENLLHAAWLNSSLSGRSPFCQLRHDIKNKRGVIITAGVSPKKGRRLRRDSTAGPSLKAWRMENVNRGATITAGVSRRRRL